MMTDLATMAALLVLAALLGGLLGWLRRDVTHKRQTDTSRNRWERRLQQAERLKVQAKDELQQVREELKDQKSAAEFLESTMTATQQTWKKRLKVAELRVEELTRRAKSAKRVKDAEETRRTEARELTAEVLEGELATANEQLDTCSKDLAEATSRARQLDLQLERAARQQRAEARKTKELEADLEDREKAVRDVRRKLDAQDLLRATLQEDLAGTHRALIESEGQIPALQARISELEAQVGSTEQLFAASGEKDDLKKIRGIGPAFERKLRKLGVDTFLQIAAWDEAEIDRVATHLGGRAGKRIRRDDWAGGARQLLAEKLA